MPPNRPEDSGDEDDSLAALSEYVDQAASDGRIYGNDSEAALRADLAAIRSSLEAVADAADPWSGPLNEESYGSRDKKDAVNRYAQLAARMRTSTEPFRHAVMRADAAVQSVRFLPNISGSITKLVASAGKQVDVWSVTSKQVVRSFHRHKATVTGLQVFASGRYVVSISLDQTIRIWDVETTEEIWCTEVMGGVRAVSIGTNDSLLVIAGNSGIVHLFSLGEMSSAAAPAQRLEPRAIEQRSLHRKRVNDICFSPSCNDVVSCGDDKQVVIWHIGDPRKLGNGSVPSGLLADRRLPHTHEVKCVAVTRKGDFIVSGSVDRIIRVWDFSELALRRTLRGHEDVATSICISHDQKLIYSASKDCTVRVWDFASGSVEKILPYSHHINCVDISADSRFLVVGTDARIIRVRNILRGVVEQVVPRRGQKNVLALAFAEDNATIAALSNETLEIFEKVGSEGIQFAPADLHNLPSSWHPSDNRHAKIRLSVSRLDPKEKLSCVAVWAEKHGPKCKGITYGTENGGFTDDIKTIRIDFDGHCTALELVPGARRAIAAAKGRVSVYDLHSEVPRSHPSHHPCCAKIWEVDHVSLTPHAGEEDVGEVVGVTAITGSYGDCKILATAGWGVLAVWKQPEPGDSDDQKTDGPLGLLWCTYQMMEQGHSECMFLSLAMDRAAEVLISGDDDEMLCVWRLQALDHDEDDHRLIRSLHSPSHVSRVTTTADGAACLCADPTGQLLVWDFDTPDPAPIAVFSLSSLVKGKRRELIEEASLASNASVIAWPEGQRIVVRELFYQRGEPQQDVLANNTLIFGSTQDLPSAISIVGPANARKVEPSATNTKDSMENVAMTPSSTLNPVVGNSKSALSHLSHASSIQTIVSNGSIEVHPRNRMGLHNSVLLSDWSTLVALAEDNVECLALHLKANHSLVFERLWPIDWTLLHYFALTGNVPAMKVCFDIAGDEAMGLKEDVLGRSALDVALEQGNVNCGEYLLSEVMKRKWPRWMLETCTSTLYFLLTSNVPNLNTFLDYCFDTPKETEKGELPSRAAFPKTETMFVGGADAPWMSRESYTDLVGDVDSKSEKSFAEMWSIMPVDIKVLHLPNIMRPDAHVLQALIETQNRSVFLARAIQAVLKFKWKRYGKSRHLRNCGSHMCFLFLFSLYAGRLAEESATQTKMDVAFTVILSGFLFNGLRREIRQMRMAGASEYLLGEDALWNWLQLASFSVLLPLLPSSLTGSFPKIRRPATSIQLLFSWTLVLFYLRGFQSTGALVRLVVQTLRGMIWFIVLISLLNVAFGMSFWILLQAEMRRVRDEQVSFGQQPHEQMFFTPLSSLVYAYRISFLGEYDPSIFDLFHRSSCPAMGYGLFFTCTLLLTVVFLNLLISIISDIYNRVQEHSVADYYREMAALILEEEQQMSEKEFQGQMCPRYLFTATAATAVMGHQQERDSKTVYEEPVLLKRIQQLQTGLSTEVDHRVQNMEKRLIKEMHVLQETSHELVETEEENRQRAKALRMESLRRQVLRNWTEVLHANHGHRGTVQ